MSSAVHTGFGHGCKRTNKSRLDCLEHNDRITYIHCCTQYGDLIKRNLDRSTELSIYFLCGGKH